MDNLKSTKQKEQSNRKENQFLSVTQSLSFFVIIAKPDLSAARRVNDPPSLSFLVLTRKPTTLVSALDSTTHRAEVSSSWKQNVEKAIPAFAGKSLTAEQWRASGLGGV